MTPVIERSPVPGAYPSRKRGSCDAEQLGRVACWSARGLTADDGAYVAVAEALEALLITDDDLILDIAEEIAHPLAGKRSGRVRVG